FFLPGTAAGFADMNERMRREGEVPTAIWAFKGDKIQWFIGNLISR
ncbi:unnamed protein product, partial [marine sediment metagenome]